MGITITISEGVARHLNRLSFDRIGDIDVKLRLLLEAEYRSHSLTDRQLAQKYGMDFEEFEKHRMTKQKEYAWEAESDAMAWETATDGMDTDRRQLTELLAERRDDEN